MKLNNIQNSIYFSQSNPNNNKARATRQSTVLSNNADQLTFTGYKPDKANKKIIKQISKLIKDKKMQRICIVSHIQPDGDAFGSKMALKHIIEEATDKRADVISAGKIPPSFKFIDPHHEIRTAEDYKKFQIPDKYDLVLALDGGDLSRFDETVQDIMKAAKKVVKIDHHPINTEIDPKQVNFGNINLVDDKKESASLLIMQFVKPLGLKLKQVTSKISDAITLGVLTDTADLRKTKGEKALFEDISELSKTSNVGKILEKINKQSISDFQGYSKLLNYVNYNEDKDIAYFVMDGAIPKEVKQASKEVLGEISSLNEVKYSFYVNEKISPDGKVAVSASIRSNDKPILKEVSKIGGGGHDYACGYFTTEKSKDEVTALILKTLNLIKNN